MQPRVGGGSKINYSAVGTLGLNVLVVKHPLHLVVSQLPPPDEMVNCISDVAVLQWRSYTARGLSMNPFVDPRSSPTTTRVAALETLAIPVEVVRVV